MSVRANSFIGQAMYQLKKFSSSRANLYVRGTVSQNVETFKVSYPETNYPIRRVVILPITEAKQLVEFSVYNKKDSVVLVESKDLSRGYELNTNDCFIIDDKRYTIKDFKDLREIRAVAFLVEHLVGQILDEKS